ncbi:MAG: energy transducer TonB [Acidobacteriota bacterium]|nr:energy transducer TonB [Acidobacteriota bacterium]
MKINLIASLICFLLICATNIFAQQPENGFELYEKGEYQKAAEVLQKAVTTNEKDRKSWLYLGMTYIKLDNKKEAVKSFEKADKINFKQSEIDKTTFKIISKPRANYTDEARRNSVSGTIKFAVEFGADGEIKEIFPFKKLPYGLTENTVESVRKIKFEPASKDGKAVSYITIVSYSFTIY